MSDEEKLYAANRVLASFSPAQIERRRGGWYVSWQVKHYTYDSAKNRVAKPSDTVSRRWSCRGQDFYPVWSRKYPGGGTSTVALSQLIRWLRGQPVFGIETWRYWASDTVLLIRKPEAINWLLEAGYPDHNTCVLCGERITGGLDWWSLNGTSGPCCGWQSGCEQKGKVVA